MESNFDTYMIKASCRMTECPYEYDISCQECVNRMTAEHDTKVMTDVINEFVHWAYIPGVDFSFMGKIKEDGTPDVVDRLNSIKSNFYKHLTEQKKGGN